MKNLTANDWYLIAIEVAIFSMVILVIWLDEFVDLPCRFLGATATPYRPQEYILETVSILALAVFSIVTSIIILRRFRRLEKFLRVCAWCRRIWIDDKWVSFEEYAFKRHSLKSSHGICEDCVTKLEKRPIKVSINNQNESEDPGQ